MQSLSCIENKNRLLKKSRENSQGESKKDDYQDPRSLRRKNELLGHSEGFNITQVLAIENRWEKVARPIGLSPLS